MAMVRMASQDAKLKNHFQNFCFTLKKKWCESNNNLFRHP